MISTNKLIELNGANFSDKPGMVKDDATVYDVQKYDGSAKTFKRAADAYDRFVELVEQSVVEAWRTRAGVG